MAKRARDGQRSKVYAAENACGCWDTQHISKGTTEAFFEACKASAYYRHVGGYASLGIEFAGARRGGACYQPNRRVIRMGNTACTSEIVVHEIAHSLTHKTHPSAPAHGGAFCRHYIELARCMGLTDYAYRLELRLREDGVRVMARDDMRTHVRRAA